MCGVCACMHVCVCVSVCAFGGIFMIIITSTETTTFPDHIPFHICLSLSLSRSLAISFRNISIYFALLAHYVSRAMVITADLGQALE